MNSNEHFDAGQLGAAIEAGAAELKKEPTDINRRLFFCELLCLQGEWQRADKQLETVAQQDQAHAVRAAIFRQLIRGELERQEVFASGRVPGFLTEPSPALTLHLRALVALREGDTGGAAALLAEAEEARTPAGGNCDGDSFDDFRDIDDLTASFFEIIMSTGKYYWVPFEVVASVEFQVPRRPRDLRWRPAHFELTGAPSIDGFVPTVYPQTVRSEDDELRLGRATQWTGGKQGPVVGVGLRMFLIGDADRSILDLNTLSFDSNG